MSLAALADAVRAARGLSREGAHRLVEDAFGDGRWVYERGDVLWRRPERTPSGAWLFRDTPAHLLWFLLAGAVGPTRVYARDGHALVDTDLGPARAWARHRLGTPVSLAVAAAEARRPVFVRLLAACGDPAPLWDACPAYYGLFACLAEALDGEGAGVVAGALCPQDRGALAGYLAAADPARPLAERKRIVRGLALRTLPPPRVHPLPPVRRAEAEAALPGFRGAAALVRVVRRLCCAETDEFPVLIPDAHRSGGRSPALDEAVGAEVRVAAGLPCAYVPPGVRARLARVGKGRGMVA